MAINLGIFDGVASLISKGIDAWTHDDKLKAEQILKSAEYEFKLTNAQIEVNKAQALHRSFFVAGARPAIMWIGVLAMISEWLVRPYLMAFYPELHIPSISDMLFEMLFALLGLGGLRSFEKFKGLTK